MCLWLAPQVAMGELAFQVMVGFPSPTWSIPTSWYLNISAQETLEQNPLIRLNKHLKGRRCDRFKNAKLLYCLFDEITFNSLYLLGVFANQSFRKSESFILIYLLCFVFVIMMTCFNLFPNFFKIKKNYSLKNRINREENEINLSESHNSRRERDLCFRIS